MSEDIEHIGMPRRSGRYPWGSGKDPYQSSSSFLGRVEELRGQGLTEKQIADAFDISIAKLRAQKAVAKNEQRKADAAQAIALKEKGYSNLAIAERLGVSDGKVRNMLSPSYAEKADTIFATADMLKKNMQNGEYLDIGEGTELRFPQLGLSKEKLASAVALLEDEGYQTFNYKINQLGTNKQTTIKVLTPPGTTFKDLYNNPDKIHIVNEKLADDGKSFLGIRPPENVSSSRIEIRYGNEGGSAKDGLIELRPGVADLSLGNSKYAQVRIAVDGTHYLKGVAVYNPDLKPGTDIVFNTNKSNTGNKLDAMKSLDLNNPDNPFGTTIKAGGQRGALNIVYEEGDWANWSRTISSQVLSKQTPDLARKQLGIDLDNRKLQLDEINKLTNPVVKQRLLTAFADSADSAAIHLKAAAMPRQENKLILPVPSMKDNEVYAPSFKNGESVVLIRHPHGGKFEIPELIVNNRQPDAKKMLGTNPKDAIAVSAKVAERLSGADFDGDTVLVIPNNSRSIKTASPLKALEGFDPKASYPPYDGMRTVDGGTWSKSQHKVVFAEGTQKSTYKQHLMGNVTNLITDMTIRGANDPELARAVKHSMVVIDSEKHSLNYKQSYIDNGIASLKTKYQTSPSNPKAGASTLISRAKSKAVVPEQTLRKASQGGSIDPETGKLVWVKTGRSYVDETGKTIPNTTSTTKMAIVDDAYKLSSGTKIEAVYANHANGLKALANSARKETLSVGTIKQSPSAAKAYAPQVESLKAKLALALENAPLERRAQVIGNSTIKAVVASDPSIKDDKDRYKKLRVQALAAGRAMTGAKRNPIEITDPEWEAIQSGAISNNLLKKIVMHTDVDKLKVLATPRTQIGMSDAQVARAKSLLAAGYTQAEVADAIGVSPSTINKIA